MQDPELLFEQIISELTSPGQLFETRDYKDSNGITHKEYASFPDNLRGYFDFGLLHGEKEFLLPVKSQAVAFNEVMLNSRLHILPTVGHMAHHFASKEISGSISYIRNFS